VRPEWSNSVQSFPDLKSRYRLFGDAVVVFDRLARTKILQL